MSHSYLCRDCGERVDEPSFTGDSYNCPHCGDDYK